MAIESRRFLLFAGTVVACIVSACLPAHVKEFNQLGHKAMVAKKYETAISYYSQSLEMVPGQKEIVIRLGTAKVLLRQIYVDRIYELVDRANAPISEFLAAWEIASRLKSLKVKDERIETIHRDLNNRFVKSERLLRKNTEPHDYYRHLTLMLGFVPDQSVENTLKEMGQSLKEQHVKAMDKADQKGLVGLALLHATAAATFAPWDTSLWPDVDSRRQRLFRELSIPLAIDVRNAGPAGVDPMFGGLRRRLPQIFVIRSLAALRLAFNVASPKTEQRQTKSRNSANCQVGTQQEINPLCPSLEQQAKVAKERFQAEKRALDMTISRCSLAASATECTNYLSSARRDVESAENDYEKKEKESGSCPRFIEKPIFKIFFYDRQTIYRQATISGHLSVIRDGQVMSTRSVLGEAVAQDTYGDGLGCAGIHPDPLQLPSMSDLQLTAENDILDKSLTELFQIQRDKAKEQLVAGKDDDRRIDGLVRARLVDENYELARDQLSTYLSSAWSSDFSLPTRVVK
ncbi:MAG: hypothetical protein V1754_11815 [Pseudomonadota bacterium]